MTEANTSKTYPEIHLNPVHPKEMKTEHWLDDFMQLYKIMEENYPYFGVKERMLGFSWFELKDQYLERIRNADCVLEIIDTFWDAVTALQNRHTIIFMPDWLENHFDKESWFQIQAPYPAIFTAEQKRYTDYWKPLLDDFFKQRFLNNFEVLILYNKGKYQIFDGHNSWKKKFGQGSEIIAVNGIPIDKAVKGTYNKGILDWDFKRNKCFTWKIAPRHFGPDAEFKLRTHQGEVKSLKFRSSPEFAYSNQFRIPEERITKKIWEDKKIGYVRINDFQDENMKEDHKILLEFFKSIREYKHLIIDVRWNEGGSYEPWMRNVIAPLCKEKLESKMNLAYRSGDYVNLFRNTADSVIQTIVPKSSLDNLPPELLSDDFTIYDYTQAVEPSGGVDFQGNIHLLIDKITFSATDAFALFCKETKFATLYGIPTGGDGISESPIFYTLPNSKLIARFTPAMGVDFTGNANEEVRVHPDIYFESEFEDQEELIEYILSRLG